MRARPPRPGRVANRALGGGPSLGGRSAPGTAGLAAGGLAFAGCRHGIAGLGGLALGRRSRRGHRRYRRALGRRRRSLPPGRSGSRVRAGARSRGGAGADARSLAAGRRGARCGSRTGRQQTERVHVALLVGGDANAQVHVRNRDLGRSAGADRPHHYALGHRCSAADGDRAEVDERHRVAARGLDRHGLAARRHRACVRDRSSRGRHDARSRGSGDVDAAMLSCRVGVRPEGERPQHGPVRGPRPGIGVTRRKGRRSDENQQDELPHLTSLRCRIGQRDQRSNRARALSISTTVRGSRGTAGCAGGR